MKKVKTAIISLTNAEKQGLNDNEQKVILAMKKTVFEIKKGLKKNIRSHKSDKGELPHDGETMEQMFDDLRERARTTLIQLGLGTP